MTIFLHELKRNRTTLLIWSLVVASMLGLCILLYPEISKQMDNMSQAFSQMGNFCKAFGMNQLNFGDFLGFFSI